MSDACLCLPFCRTIRFFFHFRKAPVKRNRYRNKAHRTANKTRILNDGGGGRLRDASIIHFVEHSTRQLLHRRPSAEHTPSRVHRLSVYSADRPLPRNRLPSSSHIFSLVYTAITGRCGLSCQTSGGQNKSIRIRHDHGTIRFELL